MAGSEPSTIYSDQIILIKIETVDMELMSHLQFLVMVQETLILQE